MEIIEDYPKGKALDFPAGWGRLSYWLQQKGHDVVACDVAPEKYTDSPIHLTKADLTKKFPFDDNTFDYAFCIDGPEHSENIYHTFREFHRVLKHDGILITSIPNFSNIESRFKQFWYGVLEPINSYEDFQRCYPVTGHMHVNRPSYALLKMAIEGSGLKVTAVNYDKEKQAQKYFYPLYLLIRMITYLKGDKGQKKYWLRDSNSKNVLMGGNTLIIVSKKQQ